MVRRLARSLTAIRISSLLDGRVPSFTTLILFRYLPTNLVALVPYIGPYLALADIVFIFGEERRCIHDLIAGTKVIIAK